MIPNHLAQFILGKIIPKVGDILYTDHRRPILTLVEDASPGIHDTLIAACDRDRYELLGVPNHDNYADNLHTALGELSLIPPEVPNPLNLFMNILLLKGSTPNLLPQSVA
ncbi:MAG: urea carboxylase-associated family protein [Kaiparowitsia implicata GSE-PSE-MK54-09C]|nr:urea carboxylase-associated family protein [Kaiparowitsia implicata GSE-PSE-MK54-09C]